MYFRLPEKTPHFTCSGFNCVSLQAAHCHRMPNVKTDVKSGWMDRKIVAVLLVTDGHKWYQWKDENKQNKLQLEMNQSAETRLNQNQTKQNTVNYGFL